jgi:anaerobic magnesium-protoporphyrin IX monomethyl ester cyclase
MDKGTRVEQIYAAVENLHAAGIKVAFFLQFGYPGEEREDIEATLKMVRECRPDDIGMSVSYPLPGTKFYENVKLQLGEKQNWLNSADFDMMYHGPYSTEFYRKLHTVLHKEFRARKTWQALSQFWILDFGFRIRGRSASAGAQRRRPTQIQNPKSKIQNPAWSLARMAYNLATLPIERRRLDRLAASSKRGIGPLPPIMTPDAAARPSGQHD